MLTPQRYLSQVAGQAPSRQRARLQRSPFARRTVGVLRELFPEPAEPVSRRVPRWLSVLLLAVAVPLGVLVMLVRVAGTPAWDGIYGEDLGIFLVQALQHPWPLLVGYAGYLQLVPRLIAQVVVYLPLRDAAAAFAIIGALVTVGCALFIFHASAGHVRSRVLRFVLALAVVLLPVAQLEIADSGVNSPWYLLFALFWAVLWRPGTRAGMAGAAAIGFLTAASTTMSVVFAPLLLARVIALPRLREHAVTVGWAAGCLLQAPYVVSNLGSAQSRAAHPASPGPVLAFYGHEVVLPALGWHLSWWVQGFAGRNGATLIIGAILAVFFGWALLTQRGQARVFVVAALMTGFLFTAVGATLKPGVTTAPVTDGFESGARYTALPIFLIEAAAIVAVGSFICRKRHRLRTVAAVTALVGVLSVGWVTDFRYQGWRGNTINWPPTATAWLHACQQAPDGIIHEPTAAWARPAIPCASLRRLYPPAGSGQVRSLTLTRTARRARNLDAGECSGANLRHREWRPMTRFLYLVRHGQADPHDGALSEAGKEQARLTGQRLSEVPFAAIYHGPLPRAAETAGLIAAFLPGVPVSACDLAGDYLPSDPDPAGRPSSFASFVARFSAAERAEGPRLAVAALERFARASDEADDTYELVVTHNFLIGWLVSQALDGPPWRWLGLNQMNCAVTVLAYLAGLPASLIIFNDAGHLPPALRWTGFPAAVRPA